MFDLAATLAALSRERPVFHSEADFQHAFAWHVHTEHPDARVRLEYRPLLHEPLNLDLWIGLPDGPIAVELKYLKRRLEIDVDGEHYSLANQAAQNYRRYAFAADIVRLERITTQRPGVTGYAVLLTNDSTHWTAPRRGDTADAAFRIYEGATLTGTLQWASGTATSTKAALAEVLTLRGSHSITWHEYSSLPGGDGFTRFRYTSVGIRDDRHALPH